MKGGFVTISFHFKDYYEISIKINGANLTNCDDILRMHYVTYNKSKMNT